MTKEERQKYNKEYGEANKDKIKEYYQANKDKIKEYREANKDNRKEYYQDNKDKWKVAHKKYREANKDKIKDKRKEYYEANKDKAKEYREANKDNRKEYYQANKDKLMAQMNEYRNKRRANDPLFKLTRIIGSSISRSIRRNGYKKTSRTAEILGCTFEVFKEHIQEQFPRDMNWDNAGMWHYDHIIPVSSATSEEGLLRLNHYTNFQPLWEEDNLEKAARLDWVKCPIKYAK